MLIVKELPSWNSRLRKVMHHTSFGDFEHYVETDPSIVTRARVCESVDEGAAQVNQSVFSAISEFMACTQRKEAA